MKNGHILVFEFSVVTTTHWRKRSLAEIGCPPCCYWAALVRNIFLDPRVENVSSLRGMLQRGLSLCKGTLALRRPFDHPRNHSIPWWDRRRHGGCVSRGRPTSSSHQRPTAPGISKSVCCCNKTHRKVYNDVLKRKPSLNIYTAVYSSFSRL